MKCNLLVRGALVIKMLILNFVSFFKNRYIETFRQIIINDDKEKILNTRQVQEICEALRITVKNNMFFFLDLSLACPGNIYVQDLVERAVGSEAVWRITAIRHLAPAAAMIRKFKPLSVEIDFNNIEAETSPNLADLFKEVAEHYTGELRIVLWQSYLAQIDCSKMIAPLVHSR